MAQSAAQTPKVAHFSVTTISGSTIATAGARFRPPPSYVNPYRVGWEEFLRHVVAGTPLPRTLAAGIRDVPFAEACHRSMAERMDR